MVIDIAGDMNNVILQTSKKTEITVDGDMNNCTFSGQNLHPGDVTSIHVGGQIYNAGSFHTVVEELPNTLPLANLPPSAINNWQTILGIAVNPDVVQSLSADRLAPGDYAQYLANHGVYLFPDNSLQSSLAYNPDTKNLTVIGAMSSSTLAKLTQQTADGRILLTVLRYDSATGLPAVSDGHFVTDTIAWASVSKINSLYQLSQGSPSLGNASGGLVVGGTGRFDVQADSIDLGNSYGIITLGNGALLKRDYSFLTPHIDTGAAITVEVKNSLKMPSSTIAALGGGSVTVNSANGLLDLGDSALEDFEAQIMKANNLGLGVYTTGGGDVSVTALGNINISSSRIGTFNGGNIFVESYQGSVNAGTGGTISIPINVFSPSYPNPNTPFEYVYANGIVAETLVNTKQTAGGAQIPGNITVLTPRGDIIASLGGILQESLNGVLSSGPVITLTAGTPGHRRFWLRQPSRTRRQYRHGNERCDWS